MAFLSSATHIAAKAKTLFANLSSPSSLRPYRKNVGNDSDEFGRDGTGLVYRSLLFDMQEFFEIVQVSPVIFSLILNRTQRLSLFRLNTSIRRIKLRFSNKFEKFVHFVANPVLYSCQPETYLFNFNMLTMNLLPQNS